jgi:phosphoribosylformylglycinamidine synthase
MAASCIDEAIRQIVAVGGDPERIAILDNFCWGNPDKPDRLGSLVRCAQGCYRAAVGYQTPFISGKDSLYNEYTQGKRSLAIPGTLLISAIGIINDVTRCVTMDLKKAGNLIYVVGVTKDEVGGSIYLDVLNRSGGVVPQPQFLSGLKTFRALARAIQQGLVRSAHDCSEGGLAVALAEMAFSGGLGVTARLDRVAFWGTNRDDARLLFSESNSRFIVEVEPNNQKKFEAALKGVALGLIGRVETSPEFVVYGIRQEPVINTTVDQLKEAWQAPLRW